MIRKFLFFLAGAFTGGQCLIIAPDSPGAIPTFPTNLTQVFPGGQNPLRLSDPSVFDRTWNLVNFAVDEAQFYEENNLSRKSYTKHKATALVKGTSQTANGVIYDVIFVVGQVNCAPPISGPPTQGGPPSPPPQNKPTVQPGPANAVTSAPIPWSPEPMPFFRCFLVDYDSSYAKCYMKFVYQAKDHSLQVQKYTCVKIGKIDAKQLLGTKADLAQSFKY